MAFSAFKIADQKQACPLDEAVNFILDSTL